MRDLRYLRDLANELQVYDSTLGSLGLSRAEPASTQSALKKVRAGGSVSMDAAMKAIRLLVTAAHSQNGISGAAWALYVDPDMFSEDRAARSSADTDVIRRLLIAAARIRPGSHYSCLDTALRHRLEAFANGRTVHGGSIVADLTCLVIADYASCGVCPCDDQDPCCCQWCRVRDAWRECKCKRCQETLNTLREVLMLGYRGVFEDRSMRLDQADASGELLIDMMVPERITPLASVTSSLHADLEEAAWRIFWALRAADQDTRIWVKSRLLLPFLEARDHKHVSLAAGALSAFSCTFCSGGAARGHSMQGQPYRTNDRLGPVLSVLALLYLERADQMKDLMNSHLAGSEAVAVPIIYELWKQCGRSKGRVAAFHTKWTDFILNMTNRGCVNALIETARSTGLIN